MYRNFSLDGRGKFFPPRGIRMELRDQRERGIEERKNFSLVTILPYLFWDSPRARHATRYRFSKGRRKSTLFDHRSGRWPGSMTPKFTKRRFNGGALASSSSPPSTGWLRNLRIAEFLYRVPTVFQPNDPRRRGAKRKAGGDFLREQRYLVLLLELRSALVLACFSSEDRLEDFLAEGITRILTHLGWGNDFLFWR